jgi:hypothetical protein
MAPTIDDRTLRWLLSGDVAIQYQVHRDLVGSGRQRLQTLRARIPREGWGKRFLARRQPDGHWGRGYYQPKWTSTHYTLMDLMHLGIPPATPSVRETVGIVFDDHIGEDGGIAFSRTSKTVRESDVCINGMALGFGAYFGMADHQLHSVIDNIMDRQMQDGGWNCMDAQGAVHSSLHSTVSILEGLLVYRSGGGRYRAGEMMSMEAAGREFILRHRLYRSHRSGEIIDRRMLMLSWPSRWRYDILRALDHFQAARCPYDARMDDALEVLAKKRRADGRWPLQAKHPGRVHFDMEQPGGVSRWNTLRALRVLAHFG